MSFLNSLIPNKKHQLTAFLSLLLLVLAIPIVGILLQENQDIRQQASGCVEQCPGPDGVLRSCTPPEDDGSSRDSLCAWAGRVEVCGNKNYCCPAAGGKWALCPKPTATPAVTASPSATIAPTIAPTVGVSPTVVPTGTTVSRDINGDGIVNQADVTILLANYGVSPLNNPKADLNGDGLVNAIDYAYLLDAYGQSN